MENESGVKSSRVGATLLTPGQRTLRARIGAYSLHAQGRTNTAPARAAFLAKFEAEVDPDRVLPVVERLRRAEAAKRAHFSRLALKAARKRSSKG